MRLNKYLLLLGFFISAFNGYSEIKVDTKDVTCQGKKDGEATISVVGASGTFQYTISRSCYILFDCDEKTQMSGNFTGLEKGSYQVVVKDLDTNCEYSKTFTINEPAELTLSVGGGGTFRFCDNQSPPTVTLTASGSGGTAPYTYSWPGGQLSVSGSGTYTCTVTDKNGCTANASVQVVMIPIVCSRDPNDIVGPAGVGPEKWVAKSASQSYTIRFENDPEFATAPAQEVRINQKLDSHINIYSLRLGNFGFGSFTFPVPPNKTFYSARLNVADSLGVFVDVTAGIDVTKGEAFWIFKSVDPATGLTPADASLGFLLVNDALRRGEGYVSYTVKAANTTVTGDSIRAMANIVFDINEAILTPEIFNTIDATPPASQINPVPDEIRGDYTFSVSASDEGSGVATYDLHISENNGPFRLLADQIAADSVFTFRGTGGSHYAMYSIARDSVGNMEPAPVSGDVAFYVPQGAFVSLTYPFGGEEFCAGDSILIRWSSHDVDEVNLYYSYNDGANYFLISEGIAAGDTSYYWMIAPSLPQGASYKIMISAAIDSMLHHTLEGRFTVNKAPVPGIISSSGQTLCYGDSTVLSVTPNAFPSYSWSTGETSPMITIRDSGVYEVSLVDYNGCQATDTISIDSYPALAPPVITPESPVSFCAGGSVELFAPDGFANYLWSTGEGTRSIVVFNSGDYSVVVTNAQGCTSPSSEMASVTVHSIPETPIIVSDGPVTICRGDSVSLFAPAGFAGYTWSTGDTTRSISVNQTGSYTVTVTSAEGCSSLASSSADVSVLPTPPTPVVAANGPLSFCEGGSVVLSAPSGYDHYHWSTGDSTRTITVTTTGNYSVAVSMENGCMSPVSDAVAVDVYESLPAPVITANGPLTFCEGGSVTLSAPDGFDKYLWSTGDSTQLIVAADSGSYSVTVGMNSGCMSPSSEEVIVTVLNTLPKPDIDVAGSLEFCQGDSVVLSGPSGYDGYLWSTGDSTQYIIVTSSGNYFLTATMNSGCAVPPSDTVTVTAHPTPSAPVVEASGPLSFCTGQSVVLSAPEGYTAYLWSTGENTRAITVTSSGNYSVTVVSENGCPSPVSDAVNVTVHENAPKPVIEAGGSLSFCEGGSVTLGTNEVYNGYLWSTGDTTSTITVSASGHYFVMGSMSEGCVSPWSDSVTVNVIPLPGVPVVQSNGPLAFCPGDSVILSGPDGLMAYLWSTGDSTQSITVTTSATVFLTVINSGGCQRTSEAVSTIATDNTPPSMTLPQDITVSAAAASCDAYVNVPAPMVADNCGVQGLINDFTNSTDASGIYPPGTTTVVWTLTDASGNVAIDSMQVTVIDGIAPSLLVPASIVREADADSCGAYVIIPVPAVSDNCQMVSLINNFTGTENASGFYPAGTTTVVWTVTDASGNVTSDSMQVTVIDGIAPSLIVPVSVVQETDADSCGAYVIIPVPAVSDNCQMVSLFNNFTGTANASGFYPVGTTTVVWTVADASGNVTMDSMQVTIEDATIPQLSQCPADITVNAGNNGSAAITWMSPVFTDACGIASVVSNYSPGDIFSAGTTTVIYTATDSNGNTNTCSFDVTVISSPLTVSLTATEYSCGFNVSCHGAHDGEVTVNVTGGTAPYSYLWSDGQTGVTGIFGAGTCSVSVTDANGTIITADITLTEPAVLASSLQVSENITCHGANNGAAQVSVSGGCAPYTYLWSNGQTSAEATGLSSGMHTIRISDVNGCTVIDTVFLSQPAALMVNAGENKIVQHGYGPGQCTTLSASVSGGVPGYTYLWSTGATTPQIQVCPNTDMVYTVTVTDMNGCVASDVVKVCVEDVSCKIGRLIKGVQVCISPSFLPWLKITLCVPEVLVPYYLSQGATLGSCAGGDACTDDATISLAANTQLMSEPAGETIRDGELYLNSHPNPFRNSTSIRMYLPGVKSASLKVYDLDGIEIAEIYNGKVESSELIEVEYAPKPDVSSGVYFLRLVTNNGKVIMKKMIYTK